MANDSNCDSTSSPSGGPSKPPANQSVMNSGQGQGHPGGECRPSEVNDRPHAMRFFCNGDQFYSGQRVYVGSKRYPTLDRLLCDLSHKMAGAVNLPYGVRQIFRLKDGRRVESVDELVLSDQKEFVCAGFESYRPIQYGQKRTGKWSVGLKPMMTSLSSRDVTQKSVRPRILAESNKDISLTKTQADVGCEIHRHHSKPNMNKSPKSEKINRMKHHKHVNPVGERVAQSEDLGKQSSPTDEHAKFNKTPANCGENDNHRVSKETRRDSEHRCKCRRLNSTSRPSSHDRVKVTNEYLAEKFEMGSVLGHGNFAVVKRCRGRTTGVEYAMKIISRWKLKGKEKVVDNELAILRRCRHANIVRLFESYETRNEIYIVMELVEGGDLFDAIRRSRKFGEAESAAMVRDVAHALSYLHHRNIIHRDVKPENILIQRQVDGSIKRLKLADFGLAAITTKPIFKLCGTPTYVAPEVLSDTGYGSEVDMWSLGVILYILLSGYPPFRSEKRDDSELFDLIQMGSFVFDSPHWDNISQEALDLIRSLLEITVQKRLTADEVLDHPWIRSGHSTSSTSASSSCSCSSVDAPCTCVKISLPPVIDNTQ